MPIGHLQAVTAELQRVNQGVTESAARMAVEDAIERRTLPPALRDWAIGLCTVSKPAFDSFVAGIAQVVAPLFQVGAVGKPPAGVSGRRLAEEDLAVCRAMNLDPDEFAKNL